MSRIADRLAAEPVAIRAGVAAVLNLLVISKIVDLEVSAGIEAAALAVINILLIASARSKVTPNDQVPEATNE